MGDTVYGYVLAKSVLRVRAERFEVTDHLRGTTQKVSEPVFDLLTVGDPDARAAREVRLPTSSDSTSKAVLQPDRRLSAFEATVAGRGPARLSSAVKVGGAVVGALLSVASAPVTAGFGIAAAAAGAAGRTTRSGGAKGPLPAAGRPDTTPEVEDSPILAAYRREHPREARLLVDYRTAIASLLDRHAQAALSMDLQTLEAATKALSFARRQARLVEEHFAGWQVDKVTRTPLGLHHEEADVDGLPTSSEVTKTFGDVDHPQSERSLRGREERWVEWGKHLGMTVSIDWQPDQHTPPDSGHFRDEIRIEYRPAQQATVTTWRIEYLPSRRVKDAGGNEHREGPRYRASKVAVMPMRLVRRDATTVKVSLDEGAFKKGTLRIAFNELGEPSEHGGEAGSLAAEALDGLPDTLKGAVETGGAIPTALVPGGAHAAALERRLAIAKARSDIDDLLAVPDPPADPDPTAELQADVALAELEARLVMARAARNGSVPSQVLYVGSPG